MLWDLIKNFSPKENWGQANGMNGLLVLLLDAIRDRLGYGIVIHCGVEADGHVRDSQHKLGNAADFHFQTAEPFLDQVDRLEKILKELQVFSKVGLGIYPDWNIPGFHLDVRGAYARWGRIGATYVGYLDACEHAQRKAATMAKA